MSTKIKKHNSHLFGSEMSISWHESRTSNFMLCFFIAKILGKLTKIDEFLIFLARRGTVWHEFGLFGDFGADGCLGTCDGAGLYERLPKCAPRCLVLKTLSL